MSKKIRITMRGRAVVVREDEKGSFWLAHIIPIVCVGIAVLIAGIVLLSFTNWGRATMMWTGLGLGIALTVYLLIAPRSRHQARSARSQLGGRRARCVRRRRHHHLAAGRDPLRSLGRIG